MDMVASRLGCERTMVGTRYIRSLLTLTTQTGLEITTITFLRGWFLARKATCALSGCMPTDIVLIIACLLMSGMVKVTSLLFKAGSEHGFSFAVRACAEMEIRCIYMLKVTSK